jgi:hypothetical protein
VDRGNKMGLSTAVAHSRRLYAAPFKSESDRAAHALPASGALAPTSYSPTRLHNGCVADFTTSARLPDADQGRGKTGSGGGGGGGPGSVGFGFASRSERFPPSARQRAELRDSRPRSGSPLQAQGAGGRAPVPPLSARAHPPRPLSQAASRASQSARRHEDEDDGWGDY